jgi:hypothetical protein
MGGVSRLATLIVVIAPTRRRARRPRGSANSPPLSRPPASKGRRLAAPRAAADHHVRATADARREETERPRPDAPGPHKVLGLDRQGGEPEDELLEERKIHLRYPSAPGKRSGSRASSKTSRIPSSCFCRRDKPG